MPPPRHADPTAANLDAEVVFVDTDGDSNRFVLKGGTLSYQPCDAAGEPKVSVRLDNLAYLEREHQLIAGGYGVHLRERGAALGELLARVRALADAAGVATNVPAGGRRAAAPAAARYGDYYGTPRQVSARHLPIFQDPAVQQLLRDWKATPQQEPLSRAAGFPADFDGELGRPLLPRDYDFEVGAPSSDPGRLAYLIATGCLRLVKGSWLVAQAQARRKLRRSQELPRAAFWEPDEAVARWISHGKLFFLSLSYGWVRKGDADDDDCFHLARVGKMVEIMMGRDPFCRSQICCGDFGVFWDYLSLPQNKVDPLDPGHRCSKDCEHPMVDPKNAHETRRFKAALPAMHAVYCHKKVTVLREDALPDWVPLTIDQRGWPLLEIVAASGRQGTYGFVRIDAGFDPAAPFAADEGPGHEDGMVKFFVRKQAGRWPPMNKPGFAAELAGRQFTSKGDRAVVERQYEAIIAHNARALGLYLQSAGLRSAGARRLVDALPDFTQLISVDLSLNPGLGDDGVRGIVGALRGVAPRLKGLWLADTGITPAARLGDALPHFRQLIGVTVGENPSLGDGGVCSILDGLLRGPARRLQSLQLANTGVADETAKAVALAIGRFPALTALDMDNNDEISDQMCDVVRAVWQNAQKPEEKLVLPDDGCEEDEEDEEEDD